jgi:putative methyltransferase (TIGR04325 family)
MNRRFVALVDNIKELPPVRALREARYERLFARTTPVQLHKGVYGSFAEAQRHAPSTLPVGYDHTSAAEMYDERSARVYPSDYPVLFWFRSVWGDVRRVFDFGGHVGIAFYAYQRYLPYGDDLRWTILDVPAVVDRGRRLAEQRAEKRLAFTDKLDDAAEGADLFLAAGSLQFVEEPLDAMLRKLQRRPRHIVINRSPFYDGEPFVTLHNNGTVICPYNVFNRDRFVASLQALGYELVDSWLNWQPGLNCFVPFHPERSVRDYSGMYLRLASTGS